MIIRWAIGNTAHPNTRCINHLRLYRPLLSTGRCRAFNTLLREFTIPRSHRSLAAPVSHLALQEPRTCIIPSCTFPAETVSCSSLLPDTSYSAAASPRSLIVGERSMGQYSKALTQPRLLTAAPHRHLTNCPILTHAQPLPRWWSILSGSVRVVDAQRFWLSRILQYLRMI